MRTIILLILAVLPIQLGWSTIEKPIALQMLLEEIEAASTLQELDDLGRKYPYSHDTSVLIALLALKSADWTASDFPSPKFETAILLLLQKEYEISHIFKASWNADLIAQMILLRHLFEKRHNELLLKEIPLYQWQEAAQSFVLSMRSYVKNGYSHHTLSAMLYVLLEPMLPAHELDYLVLDMKWTYIQWHTLGRNTPLESVLINYSHYWPKTPVFEKHITHLIQRQLIHLALPLQDPSTLHKWQDMLAYFLSQNQSPPKTLVNHLTPVILSLQHGPFVHSEPLERSVFLARNTIPFQALFLSRTEALPSSMSSTLSALIHLIAFKPYRSYTDWALLLSLAAHLPPEHPERYLWDELIHAITGDTPPYSVIKYISQQKLHMKPKLTEPILQLLALQPVWPKSIINWVQTLQTAHPNATHLAQAWEAYQTATVFKKMWIKFKTLCEMR